MNAILPVRLTVDEFLRWSMDQDRGRFELEGGRIIALPSETWDHTDTKSRVYLALLAALQRSGLPFYAAPDGPTVRIEDDRAYEPDALLAPLPKPDGRSLEIANPVVVFEVLSPSPNSVKRDLGTKLHGYGRVASIAHYVVVDPDDRTVFHFRREGGRLVPEKELSCGLLKLDPPGIEIPVADLLLPPG